MKRLKRIVFLVIIIFLLTVNYNIVCAGDIVEQAKNWIDIGSNGSALDTTKASEGFEDLASLIWGIGLFVVLISTAVIGIRFMVSGVSKRAEILQSMMPFLIGTVIIFGALTIWKVLIESLDGAI